MPKSSAKLTSDDLAIYQILLDSATDAVVLVDDNGIIRLANGHMETLFGHSRDQLIGRSVDVLLPERLQMAHSAFRQGYFAHPERRDMGANRVLVGLRADGEEFPIEVTLNPIETEDGTLVMSLISDITERNRTQQQLRDSEEKYRVLLESAAEGIVIVNAAGTIELVNRRAEELFGYSREELLGQPIEVLIPERYHANHHRFRGGYTERPQQRPMGIGRELLGRRKDGSEFPLEVSLSPVELGEQRLIMSFIIDITERKRSEAARRKSEADNKALLDAIPDMMMRFSRDGTYLAYKAPANKKMPSDYQKLLNQNIKDLFSPKLADRFKLCFDRALESGAIEIFDFEYPVGNHKQHFEARIVANGPDEVLVILRDFTEHRQAQKLAEMRQQQLLQADKMATLGTLVSGVAHEINNPNNFILLNANIISEVWKNIGPVLERHYEDNGDFTMAGMPYSRAKEKIARLIDGIAEGAVRIQKIVESLKNFARQDAGELNQTVDLNVIMESAITITHNLIKRSTNHFTVEYGEGLPAVRGNAQQLEQVIINLITNSCQALPSTDRKLQLRTALDRTGTHVRVTVQDDGSGISKENMKHIFDPFFTTKRTSGGTGLGLSISYNIIQRHQGKLTLDSLPGRGTTAIITLPIMKTVPQIEVY